MAKIKKNPYMVNYYSKGGVSLLPNIVTDNSRYIALPFSAKALLVEIASQYKGHNNGDLCATRSLLKGKGFNSQNTLSRALKALLEAELILLTRQGGKDWVSGANLPNLYAVSWQPINECFDRNGKPKLETPSTTRPSINFEAENRKKKNP